MKKQLVILGISVLLICIGLSGCNEVGVGLTNIGDITANPNDYIGKEVTIEGSCGSVIGNYGVITDLGGHNILYNYQNSLNGNYRLTGMIQKGTGMYASSYVIVVNKAKAI